MSGSGATCFALFNDAARRDAAAAAIRAAHPLWWVMATRLS
jgi:4-diphosphocytidyl-2-C-methyl-D-erythritol kinase